MTTTTLARFGKLDRHVQADGWYAYINNGEYTSEQQNTLVDALMAAQRAEFDDLLPEGCTWQPGVSESIGPVSIDLGEQEEIMELLTTACDAVIARFDAIEAEALAGQA